MWDGFQRVNTDTKSGGIVGVFKQGAKETSRTVTVNYLEPGTIYLVKQAPTGKVIAQLTGKELEEKGFGVALSGKYDGELFEIVNK
jgi:alpha-galactosidase